MKMSTPYKLVIEIRVKKKKKKKTRNQIEWPIYQKVQKPSLTIHLFAIVQHSPCIQYTPVIVIAITLYVIDLVVYSRCYIRLTNITCLAVIQGSY